MQYSMIAAPAAPDTSAPEELAQSLGVDDPTMVIALIAEVDAIFCAAEAPCRQQPTPPAIGCALHEPRCAGRSLEYTSRRPRRGPVRCMTPVQRSPPEAAAAWYLRHQGWAVRRRGHTVGALQAEAPMPNLGNAPRR